MLRKQLQMITLVTIFLASLFIVTFSVFNIVTAGSKVEEAIDEWEEIKQNISKNDKLHLDSLTLPDINREEKKAEDKEEVPPTYERGEVMGKIVIPKLQRELPIIHGTDAEELDKGVGHYIGTALPGEADQVVLAGHRDTVFVGLGEVGIGDTIEVETASGHLVYEVYEQLIVESDDRTVIVPYDEPVLTLITCYPFNFVGSAPQRYILTAKLVE